MKIMLNENEEILDKTKPQLGTILGAYLFIFLIIAGVVVISKSYDYGFLETFLATLFAYPLVHIFVYFLNIDVILTTQRLIFKDPVTLQTVNIPLNKVNIVYLGFNPYASDTRGFSITIQENNQKFKKYSIIVPRNSGIMENLINHIKINVPRNSLNINKCKLNRLGN